MESLSSPARSTHGPRALHEVPTRLVVVIGLHLGALWALINGLHVHVFPVPTPKTEATVIDTAAPPPEKFIPPDFTPNPTTTVVEQLPPVIPELVTSDPTPPATVDTLPPIGPGAVATIPTPVITNAAVDPRHPLTQPAYPMASIRGNEQGALNLSVLVGIDGRVRDAKVAESSGSARLDQAAVEEAKSRWHLRPATRDGLPFEQWLTLRVVFRLENR
jgi:periplasmic protein TonB